MSQVHDVERLVRKVEVVLEIGPGIHPQTGYASRVYVAIEPHGEYANFLEGNGLFVIREPAIQALHTIGQVDSIIMLDVLEHMGKTEALNVLHMAKQRVRQQLVVFTTLGFIAQDYKPGEKDAWGMNGVYWQTHRSGWQPQEFHDFKHIGVDPGFHGERGGAIFAIYEPKE